MLRTACLLVVLMAARAHADRRIEIGGEVGYTSAKTIETFDCPPPSGTGDVCISSSEPHYREPGFSVGAHLRVPIHRAALLEGALAYTQKGINGGPNGTHRTYHYIEAPLLAQVDPLRASSHARLFAYGGLAPAVRVACTVEGPIFDNDTHMAVNYSGTCTSLPVPLNRQPNVFDLGLVLGAGFGLELPFGTIEVQARYTHGLIDTEGDGGGKTINRTLYVLVGYDATLRL